jgi:hypothetical protein
MLQAIHILPCPGPTSTTCGISSLGNRRRCIGQSVINEGFSDPRQIDLVILRPIDEELGCTVATFMVNFARSA